MYFVSFYADKNDRNDKYIWITGYTLRPTVISYYDIYVTSVKQTSEVVVKN